MDAQVLAAMSAALRLWQTKARSSAQRDLNELVTAHDGLAGDRVAALNRRKHVCCELLKRHIHNRLAHVER